MIRLDVPQGSQEWLTARLGTPSASCFDKIITTKGEPSNSRTKYMYQLAVERLTALKGDSFYQNQDMDRGIEVEAEARALYEMLTEETVSPGGVCFLDEAKTCCCSPDGLIGEDGGLELKCPSGAVHVDYLLKGELPSEYFQQVQGSLYVTGRKWWSFVSYFPGIKPLILKVERDEKFIAALEFELNQFNKELEIVINKIK